MTDRIKKIVISLFITLQLVFFPAGNNIFAISIEEETRAGEDFVKSVKQQVQLVEDDFVNDYINRLGSFLSEALETRHFSNSFYVVQEDELNAFATFGGHIFIYSGLIETMEIEELASVMCHELAHVSSRHLSQSMEQYRNVNIASMAGVLAGILVGGKAAGAIITGSLAAGQQQLLSYSRDDERQADQVGFEYCLKSGFDPRAFKSALNKLQKGRWGVSKIPAYLLTHPLGSERISNMDALLAAAGTPETRAETEWFIKNYPVFRTIIRAGYWNKKSAEPYYINELQNNPDSPLSHLGMAIIRKDKGEYQTAIEHFTVAAEKLAEPVIALRYLAETFQFTGQDEKSIEILEGLIEKDHRDRGSLFLLASALLNIRDYSRSIEILEKLKYMPPVRDEVYYKLGLSYGRDNRLGRAHYNFGLYFEKRGMLDKADFHFMTAEKEAKDDPELIEKIRRIMREVKEKKEKRPSNNDTKKQPEWFSG